MKTDTTAPSLNETLDALEEMLESYELANARLTSEEDRGRFLRAFHEGKRRSIEMLEKAGRSWPKKRKST